MVVFKAAFSKLGIGMLFFAIEFIDLIQLKFIFKTHLNEKKRKILTETIKSIYCIKKHLTVESNHGQ